MAKSHGGSKQPAERQRYSDDAAKSIEDLEVQAEKIREAGERDKEGRLLPRYPGLLKPPLNGFDKSAFRKALVDSQSKLAKWVNLAEAAKRLGYDDVWKMRDEVELLTWFGLGWKASGKRVKVKLRRYRDDEKLQTTYVLHTPDAGRIFSYICIEVEAAP